MTRNIPMKELLSANIQPTTADGQIISERKRTQDEADMARFGKRQQLRRRFGFVSIIGLTCTLMITWEGVLSVFTSGFQNGGPSGLVYGYLVVWAGSLASTLTMAEMASMIPLSGGQYNWVATLAPRSCSKFLSYLTGWVTVIGWQAGTASATFLAGTMVQGLLVLNYPSYVFERWHGTLLLYAVVLFALFVNTFLASQLPTIEGMILIVHIAGFFGVLIPLVYFAPHGSPTDVFGTFLDQGNWNSIGLAFFIGLVTSIFSFIGVDAAAHMAEEVHNASVIIPWSMISTMLINGALGFAMLIAVLFCLGNLDNALNTPTGFPFMEIFAQATGSNGGATAMSCIILVAQIFAAIGLLATASRMTWAFARENGLPFSKYLARVEPRTALPLWSIGLTTTISLLLALINIGSSTALNAVLSLVTAGFYSSFLIAAVVLLIKRLRTTDRDMEWGPFQLGKWGLPINIFSVGYTIIGIFFSFWPPSSSVTLMTMNWSSLMFGSVILFSIGFWLIYGRHVYTGPIKEIRNRDFVYETIQEEDRKNGL